MIKQIINKIKIINTSIDGKELITHMSKRIMLVGLVIFGLCTFCLTGCSSSSSQDQIPSSLYQTAYFNYDGRIYTCRHFTPKFNSSSNEYEIQPLEIEGLNEGSYLIQLEAGWNEVATLKTDKSSVMNEHDLETYKLDQENESTIKNEVVCFTSRIEIFSDSLDYSHVNMADAPIYMMDNNPYYAYLKIDDKYYLFVDEHLDDDWIINDGKFYISGARYQQFMTLDGKLCQWQSKDMLSSMPQAPTYEEVMTTYQDLGVPIQRTWALNNNYLPENGLCTNIASIKVCDVTDNNNHYTCSYEHAFISPDESIIALYCSPADGNNTTSSNGIFYRYNLGN